jgi:protein tyrosine/serine phosphatase
MRLMISWGRMRTISRMFVSALALILARGALAEDASPDGGVTELTSALTNFHEVDPGAVLRGARPTPEGVAALAKAGVHTLIDLQGGDLESVSLRKVVGFAEAGEKPENIDAEQKEVESHGMRFVHLPLNSLHRLTPGEVSEVMAALRTLHDPTSQPVYLHCEHGHDRTGLVMALYRVRYDHWTPKAAYAEMVALGHSGTLDHFATGDLDYDFWELASVFEAEALESPAPRTK